MLQNLYMTFSVVFPFLVYLGIGIWLRHSKMVDEHATAKMNRFVAQVLFPVNLFNVAYKIDLGAMLRQPTALYVALLFGLSLGFLMLVVPRLEKDPARQCTMVHCGFRTNITLYAIAVSEGIFGEMVPEVTLTLVLLTLLNNITSVPVLERYQKKILAARGDQAAVKKTSPAALVLGWLKNPLLVGLLLGMLWSLARIPMPELGAKTINNISVCAVPISFIMLGARLDLNHLRINSRNILLTTLYKLVLIPLVAFIYPIAAGWTPRQLIAVLVAFATPTAVVTYVTTIEYDGDGEMAGEIVSVSTVFSMLTIFLFLFGLRQAGLI